MPQVASDLTHALKHSLSRATRPPQAAEPAQASPFESLLDETAPPAPEPRARPADDSASRSDPAQKNPVKSADKTDRAVKSDDSAKSANAKSTNAKSASAKAAEGDAAMAPAEELELAAEGQPVVVAVAVEQAQPGDIVTTDGDDANQTGDGKPAETVEADAQPDAAAIVPAAAQAPAPTGANAIAVVVEGAVVPVATPDVTATPVPETGKIDIAAAGTQTVQKAQTAQPDAIAALLVKPEKKPDGEKPAAGAADAKVAFKASSEALSEASPKASPKAAAAQFVPDGEARPATGAAKKAASPQAQSIAQSEAPSETATNSHRNASAELAGTTGADSHAAVPKVAPDAAHPQILTAPAPTAPTPAQGPALAAAAQPAPQAAAVPIAGVAIEITSKAKSGTNHFEIRLDPPELGRIHVHLDVDRDGNVTSHLIADRSDTLDLLRRDTAGLERALQDAGLKTANNSLQFTLRDHSANQQQSGNSGANTAQLIVEDESLPAIDAAQYARLGGRSGGLDISV